MVTIPFSSVTGTQVIVDTHGGDDALTIDLSLGNFSKEIVYDGGDNDSSIPGDQLFLVNATVADATFNFENANEGSIELSGNQTISYTGLEPIISSLDVSIYTTRDALSFVSFLPRGATL